MGRTVPAFRLAAEMERTKWKQFRSLLDKKDRKMFDEMFDYVKLYNSACMMACKPLVIHSVLMSIIFQHYKQLKSLEEGHRVGFAPEPSTLDNWAENLDNGEMSSGKINSFI